MDSAPLIDLAHDPHPRRNVRVLDTAMSYVDTGTGKPVVFLHGNPTSSYLWRNIIPFVSGAARCLAPDLIGMGRSGKPAGSSYRFTDHARYLDAWFDALDLRDVVLVLHDWGSALGFHWARRHADRVAAIAYMEALVQPRLWSDFAHGRDAIFRALRSDAGERMVLDDRALLKDPRHLRVVRDLARTHGRRLLVVSSSRSGPLSSAGVEAILGRPERVYHLKHWRAGLYHTER